MSDIQDYSHKLQYLRNKLGNPTILPAPMPSYPSYPDDDGGGGQINFNNTIHDAITAISVKPWYIRIWILLSNPFIYIFTGKIRW